MQRSVKVQTEGLTHFPDAPSFNDKVGAEDFPAAIQQA
jgi:hypothetical protein